MEYEKMLDRVYAALPEKTKKHERFQMPEAESFIQGNRTIVKNFGQLLKSINRDSAHFCKFIARETATSNTIDEAGRLVLTGKFGSQQLKDLVKSYVEQFVLCPECRKPDTKVVEKQGVRMLKCEACGAISAVKGL